MIAILRKSFIFLNLVTKNQIFFQNETGFTKNMQKLLLTTLIITCFIDIAQAINSYYLPSSMQKGYDEEQLTESALMQAIDRDSENYLEQMQEYFDYNNQLFKEGMEGKDPNKIYFYYNNLINIYTNFIADKDKKASLLKEAKEYARKNHNMEALLFFLRKEGVFLDQDGLPAVALDTFWLGLEICKKANLPIMEAIFNQHIAFALKKYVGDEKAIEEANALNLKSVQIYDLSLIHI